MSCTTSAESLWDRTPLNKKTIMPFGSEIDSSLKKEVNYEITTFSTSDGPASESKINSEDEPKLNFKKVKQKSLDKFSNVKAHVVQKWVGNVLSIDDSKEEFSSIIKDVTNPNFEDEYVTIGYEELSTYDLAFLKAGAIFYWTIGYRMSGETKSKFSEINMQRLVVAKKASSNAESEFEEFEALFSDDN